MKIDPGYGLVVGLVVLGIIGCVASFFLGYYLNPKQPCLVITYEKDGGTKYQTTSSCYFTGKIKEESI
jgi:hypothetical protein